MLKIYNTLSGKKENFIPINKNKIGIYVCGMTVYDYCHIGHARILIMFDVIVCHLKRNFKNVVYVRNITDIDDKIIQSAIKNKEKISLLTSRFIDAMHKDELALNITKPNYEPRVTDFISQIIKIIKKILKKNMAYQTKSGDVYYAVRKFKNYGNLSKKKLSELIAGARVSIEHAKKDPLDFVLWKMSKHNEPSWDSPWGYGRPGWHIECSAMAEHFLGKHFDIHGGGSDLVFPHHENEIAQSESANNCSFVNTWMHVGFVNVDNNKMSKSLNNFFTIKKILKKYDAEVLRYFIMSSHYRSPLNFNDANLIISKNMVFRIYTAVRYLDINTLNTTKLSICDNYEKHFNSALDDDFNTPIALRVLLKLVKKINTIRNVDLKKATILAQLLKKLANYIGILQVDVEKFFKRSVVLTDAQISKYIKLRDEARKNKDFILADSIRDELMRFHIILEDSKTKTIWRG